MTYICTSERHKYNNADGISKFQKTTKAMKAVKKAVTTNKAVTMPLEAAEAKRLLQRLKADGKHKLHLIAKLALNTGLRIGDVIGLSYEQLKQLAAGHTVYIVERKTGKSQKIDFTHNAQLTKDLAAYCKRLEADGAAFGYAFTSRNNNYKNGSGHITLVAVNAQLKTAFAKYAISTKNGKVCSHIFRKTYAYTMYQKLGANHEALLIVSRALNHASTATTLTYLGITQSEVEAAKAAIIF